MCVQHGAVKTLRECSHEECNRRAQPGLSVCGKHGAGWNNTAESDKCAALQHNQGRGFKFPRLCCEVCGKANLCSTCGLRMIAIKVLRSATKRKEYQNQGFRVDLCHECHQFKYFGSYVKIQYILVQHILSLSYNGISLVDLLELGRIYPKISSSGEMIKYGEKWSAPEETEETVKWSTTDLTLVVDVGVKVIVEADEGGHDNHNYPVKRDHWRNQLIQSHSEEAIVFVRIDVGKRKGPSIIQDAQNKQAGICVLAWIKKLREGKPPKGWVGVHYLDYTPTNKHVRYATNNCGDLTSMFYDWVGESETNETGLLTAVENEF